LTLAGDFSQLGNTAFGYATQGYQPCPNRVGEGFELLQQIVC